MAGYYTAKGFYGFVDGSYEYFASQSDYVTEIEGRCVRGGEFAYYEQFLDEPWD